MSKCDIKHLFGVAVRKQRIEHGFSQEELADRSGLHRTYISDVERGARNLSLASIERLAQALETSVSTLFSRAGNGCGPDPFVEMLLVEDNPHDVDLTLRAFERARIRNPVHVARDGAEALEFLFAPGADSEDGGRVLPGLILLDLKLPKIDGMEVLRHIRADKRTRAIPVVVLTGSSRDDDVAECRQLGIINYIVKPVDFYNFCELTPRLDLEWVLRKPTRSGLRGSDRDEARAR